MEKRTRVVVVVVVVVVKFIADVCLHQSVNQLYNHQKMAKRVLFSKCSIVCP